MSTSLIAAVIAAAVAAGTGLALHALLDTPPQSAAAATNDDGAVVARVEALESKLAAAIDRLDAASAQLEAAAVQRAQERASAPQSQPVAAAAGTPTTAKGVAEPDEFTMTDAELAGVIGELLAPGSSYENDEMLWEKIKAAGQLEAAIAKIEEMVADDPQNANLQTELGSAYLQKLFVVPEGPAKGIWAMKADGAFDAALSANPQHWDARFSKAVSLSFWPPVLGKQGEAVSHFETLVQQQEASGTSKPEFAQTYLFLGNLYELQGKSDKAKEAWAKGAGMFPASAELQAKLGK